jgi:cytochrome c-type biogenesis protein CcmF
VLTPRLNYYERSNDPIGTPSVQSYLAEDFYVSLLAFSDDGRSASFNAWIFPLVGWIWWMIPMLVGGALISLWPTRYKALAFSAVPHSSAAIKTSPGSAA